MRERRQACKAMQGRQSGGLGTGSSGGIGAEKPGFATSCRGTLLPGNALTLTNPLPFIPPPPEAVVVPATPQYCKVVGAIRPVDPTAPPIRFQVNLPTRWNGVDMLDTLVQWVEQGRAPLDLVQVELEPVLPFPVVRSRPMCRWPATMRYRGHGDPLRASSFECAQPH